MRKAPLPPFAGSVTGPLPTIGGRFKLLRQVAQGGMGIIYQVRDESDGKLAALKLMHAAAADDVTRFFREAQLLSTIHHPGIVSYIAHGTDDSGSPYLVMEWLDGEDLSRRLARGVLSFRETVTLFRELSSAVSLMHEQGIVHRARPLLSKATRRVSRAGRSRRGAWENFHPSPCVENDSARRLAGSAWYAVAWGKRNRSQGPWTGTQR